MVGSLWALKPNFVRKITDVHSDCTAAVVFLSSDSLPRVCVVEYLFQAKILVEIY